MTYRYRAEKTICDRTVTFYITLRARSLWVATHEAAALGKALGLLLVGPC